MKWRFMTARDITGIVDLNRQLQQEEGAAVMNTHDLATRLAKWLKTDYRGVVFEREAQLVAYALFRDTDPFSEGEDGIFLRQFFVVASERRKGIGRAAFTLLLNEIWPPDKIIFLEALSSNPAGHAFWQSMGFNPHSVTYAYHR
jgi:GNAT superfamily N-acetyltransferase